METDYNPEHDLLLIEKQDWNDYSESLESGGFVLDLDSESGFLGMEIIDASQKTSLSREDLGSVRSATVDLEENRESFDVRITLSFDGGERVITRNYPRKAVA